jgi:hypothetical protein
MPYTLQFIGLAHFIKSRSGGMRVLLPDGTNYRQIAPHRASISVQRDAVRASKGWRDGEIDTDASQTEFWFPPSTLHFEAADERGKIASSKLLPFLPSLKRSNPDIRIDPERAHTIADITFQQGRFQAFRYPGGKDDGKSALVVQVELPHDGVINIKVVPKRWSDGGVRTIRLAPGTEIAIVNTSRGEHAFEVPELEHFQIYEQLSYVPVRLKEPRIPKGLPAAPSAHPAYAAAQPAHVLPTCSATS